MNVLKQFGLGILWALLFPFILVVIALIGVFGVFNFFVQFIIMIVNFFRGKKLFPPLPEDEKAYEILKKAYAQEDAKQEQPIQEVDQSKQIYIQNNYYQQPGQPMPNPQNPYLQQPNPYQQQNPYLQQPNPAIQNQGTKQITNQNSAGSEPNPLPAIPKKEEPAKQGKEGDK